MAIMRVKEWISSHWHIGCIVFIFALINSMIAVQIQGVIWDEAVYIGIAKYFYTSGALGYLEEIRPPLWPLVIGIFWKVGLPIQISAKIVNIALASILALLLFKIGSWYSKATGIFASLILIATPVFFNHSTKMLTDIFAACWVLAVVYAWYTEKHPCILGVLIGLAFLTRFQMGLILGILFIALVLELFTLHKRMREIMKKCTYLCIGFMIIITPYLIFNYATYRPFTSNASDAIMRPFLLAFPHQQNPAESIPGVWNNLVYYPSNLLKENIVLVVSLIGLYCSLNILRKQYKERAGSKELFILLILGILGAYFTAIPNKQMRFSFTFLPILCLFAARGIEHLYNRFRIQKHIWSMYIFLLLWVGYSVYITVPWNIVYHGHDDAFGERIREIYTNTTLRGTVVTTFPLPLAYLNLPFLSISYSPIVAYKNFAENPKVKTIIYTPTMQWCAESDAACREEAQSLLNTLYQKHTLVATVDFVSHPVYIFKKEYFKNSNIVKAPNNNKIKQ